jgi:hypothetical protein
VRRGGDFGQVAPVAVDPGLLDHNQRGEFFFVGLWLLAELGGELAKGVAVVGHPFAHPDTGSGRIGSCELIPSFVSAAP